MRREHSDDFVAEVIRTGFKQGRRIVQHDWTRALRADGLERSRANIRCGDFVELLQLCKVGKHDFREFRTVKYAVRVGYAAEGGIERGQHFAVLRTERAIHRVRVHPARAESAHTRGNRAFAGADTLATSYALATAIRKIGEYDVIVGGRQAIDGDTAQVGPQVAEKLGLPQVTYVEEIQEVKDGRIRVKRHIDGGVETVEAPLPIVLTVNGSAAPCRPRNAKLVQKYKRALGGQEKAAITKDGAELPYASLYESRPYLNITEWSVADVNGDTKQCGLSGSPTKVKKIENIIFQAKESKTLTGSDADVENLIVELLANHTIG